MKKRIVVLGGKTGFLGQALSQELSKAGFDVRCPMRHELDITSQYCVEKYINSVEPDVIFNAIAYTSVDEAESDYDCAYFLNSQFCRILGKCIVKIPTSCFSFSTDFVFDGKKRTPYTESDQPNPISVYGTTKLDGENHLLDLAPDKVVIARTAWLFGPHKTNFVQKILKLAQGRKQISVVNDQVGSPTYTVDVSKMCIELLLSDQKGIFHLVNSGQANWYALAAKAVEVMGIDCNIIPVASEELNQIAKRPSYSVLSNEKFFASVKAVCPVSWEKSLCDYLECKQAS